MKTVNWLSLVIIVFCGSISAIHLPWATLSISSLHQLIRKGAKCQDIIQDFLTRIQKFDKNRTPPLGGTISVNGPGALKVAKQLDKYYEKTGHMLDSLHCVPVLPKDNIDAAGLPTTGGIKALAIAVPNQDAALVAALVKKGAVVIGKANMAPLAQESARTHSETGGLARNPYDPTRTTYGSSGGNGVAGAAVYTIIGIGTDTSGSVVLPSSAANLIGLRPTTGKLSIRGVLAGNHLQDTAGPMTRWVADLAVAMDALEPQVAASGHPKYATPDVLDEDALNGMKIAVLELLTFGNFSLPIKNQTFTYKLKGEALGLAKTTVSNFLKAGAHVTNYTGVDLMVMGQYLMPMLMLPLKLSACKAAWYDAYFKSFTGKSAFPDFEHFKESPLLPKAMREGFQKAWERRDQCAEVTAEFGSLQKVFLEKLVEPMFQPDIDIVIFPTLPNFPEKIPDASEDGITGVVVAPFSGFPSLNLPMGLSSPTPEAKNGLPLGMTLLAKPNREDLLIKAAYGYQKKFGSVKLPWTVME